MKVPSNPIKNYALTLILWLPIMAFSQNKIDKNIVQETKKDLIKAFQPDATFKTEFVSAQTEGEEIYILAKVIGQETGWWAVAKTQIGTNTTKVIYADQSPFYPEIAKQLQETVPTPVLLRMARDYFIAQIQEEGGNSAYQVELTRAQKAGMGNPSPQIKPILKSLGIELP